MQVSVENTSSLGRRLTVLVPSQNIQSIIQTKMGEFSQRANLPGFRPGNIPKKILEQKYGAQVRKEAIGQIIETSLPRALEQENLKPAGQPIVEQVQNITDSDFKYVVNFEIFPEITLADFSSIQAEKYEVSISEQDIDNTIEKLKKQLSEWVSVDRPIKEGDRVILDYTSTVNGKPYENHSAQDIKVEIGSRLFLEGFEPGIIGMKVGDEKTLDLVFPKEWRIEKLAGKPVVFNVKIKSISEKHEAKLDEAFAKKIGAASAELAVIREKVSDNLKKQVKEMIDSNLKDQVSDALLKMNPIPLPKALVDRESAVLHEEHHRRLGDQPNQACHHEGIEEQAQKRVALGLILNEVIKIEKLTPNPEEVKSRINAISKMFGNEEFLAEMYEKSDELLAGVRHTVLLDQALDVVISRSSITEKKITVDELFKH